MAGADLTGVILTGADLCGANLTGTVIRLGNRRFSLITCPEE